MSTEVLLTIDEAAKRLAISKRTLEREIAAQRFPKPLKIGRSSRVPESDVQAYVAALRSERPALLRAM
ncbi:MAG: helix-turn-helix domain-containing protein [Candidatus Didemnitutus sp.]|nr:helix-turn-helix domain-containing protein [Candidatus Didemnitutus sp.]